MITLEQVKLLESKISKTVDYIQKVTGENTALKGKLGTYEKRIEELEALIQLFREDQGRIEDTILSALDRLNQFEDAVESVMPKESARPVARPAENRIPAKKEETTPAGCAESKQKKNEASLEPVLPAHLPDAPEPEENSVDGELDIF